jgi:hypothetical protein
MAEVAGNPAAELVPGRNGLEMVHSMAVVEGTEVA